MCPWISMAVNCLRKENTTTDLLGTFGPQHFSTAAYTYRRDWQTWSGLVTLSWRQSFGRKYVRQAEDRSAGGLYRRIK